MHSSAFDNEDFRNILKQYEQALKNNESIFLDADEFTDIADYYFSHNQLKKAEEVCKIAFAIHPDSSLVQVLQANMFLNIYDDIKSAKRIIEGIKDKSELAYIYTNTDIMLREEKFDEANNYLSTVLQDLSEDDIESFSLDVAELFIDYEEIEFARRWLALCSIHDDDYKEIEARILFHEQEFEKVIDIISDLLNRHSYEEYLWCLLAKAQFLTKQYEEALNSCDFAIAIEPEGNEAVELKGFIHYTIGNISDAKSCFEQYIKWYPDELKVIEALAGCYVISKQYDDAIPLLEKYLQIQKKDNTIESVDIYRNLALSYSGIGKVDKAIEYANMMGTIPEMYPHNIVIKVYIYLENDNITDALICIEEALTHSNGNPDIVTDIAIALHESGYNDMAYDMTLQLMDNITFDYAKGNACLALFAYYKRERQTYLKCLKKAVETDLHTAETLLEELFPIGTEPSEYYIFAKNNHLF